MTPQIDLYKKTDGTVQFRCVRVKQPIGDFFIGSIGSKDLIDITYADVRRINAEEREIESYLGIQRPLDKKRVKELTEYVRTVDACFPTAVILSVDGKCAEFDESTGVMTLSPYTDNTELGAESIEYGRIARVIDGQHRIAGLEAYSGDEFEMNVSVFVDIDPSTEAYIFSTVNLAQTKVNKSLVYDLYDLARKNSPQKVCHLIAVSLDQTEGSPLERRIKRLGSASSHDLPSAITQAAFVHALIPYISSNPKLDRDLYMRGKFIPRAEGREADKLIFRNFMIDNREYDLTDLLWNYFDAVRMRWPTAWASLDKGTMLSRTNGFMALMRFLKDCYLELGTRDWVYTADQFLELLNRIDLSDSTFRTDIFKPGTSGESRLYRSLKAEKLVD